MEESRNLVVFDVGRTLVNATHKDIIKFFLAKGKVNKPFLLLIVFLFWVHKVVGINEKMVCFITTRAFGVFGGIKKTELEQLSKEYYETDFKGKMFDKSIEIIKKHKEKGDEVVLISALLPTVIDCARRDLGLNYMIVPELEYKKGVTTGKVISLVPYGSNKLVLTEKFVKDHKMSFKGSYFYSDRVSDVPLFKKVENRIVFNPEPKLRDYAKQEGWEVIELI